jgi:hypothetical protein
MSDGNFHKTKKIFRLCTNNYTKEEVELLSKTIYIKYNIESRLERVSLRNNQYILVIRKTEVHKLQVLIKNYIIPSMLYRIGL